MFRCLVLSDQQFEIYKYSVHIVMKAGNLRQRKQTENILGLFDLKKKKEEAPH